jgi:hypothetical protein
MSSLTTNINYLQPTAFKLVIDRKKFGNVEYFAQSVSHPSVSIPPADVPYSRVNLHVAGDKLTFGELGARIIIDENMTAYIELFDWVNRLVVEANKTRSRDLTDEYPTAVDITLIILDSKNNQVKAIRYIDCIPTDIGGIELEATTSDVQFLTFDITFKFSYFEIV